MKLSSIFLVSKFASKFNLFCYYEGALRSKKNAFKDPALANKGYAKGESALVDALLLSRCDALLKPSSAVSEFAVYFAGGKIHGLDGGDGTGVDGTGGDGTGGDGGTVWEMQFIAGYNELSGDGRKVAKVVKVSKEATEKQQKITVKQSEATDSASARIIDDDEETASGFVVEIEGGDEESKNWVPLEVSSADLLSEGSKRGDVLLAVVSGAIPAVIIRGVITPQQAAAALAATPAAVLGSGRSDTSDGKGVDSSQVKQVHILGAQLHDFLRAVMERDAYKAEGGGEGEGMVGLYKLKLRGFNP